MKFGLSIFITDLSIAPHEVAREAEARGFESILFPEKTHVPVSRKTPWPGGELPEHYKRTYDPFVALSAAAAATSRIRIGTGICLVAVRDPIILAKEVASLDALSGGRFIFGVGYGWNAEEMEDHGIDFSKRGAIMRDKIHAMEVLWSDDEGSYQGEFVRFEAAWSWPKPAQRPRPPILVGSRASAEIFADIADYADGWMPIEYYGKTVEHIPALRAAFVAAGRDPLTAEVSVFQSFGNEDMLERYAEAGVQRVILGLPAAGREEVLPVLDAHTKLIERFS